MELFRPGAIIERMLGDLRRIIAVRTNMNLGQTARFLDWRDGQMRNGKVIAMKDPQVTLHKEGARRESLSCHAVIRHEAKKNPLRWGRRAGLRLCETL